MLNMILGKTDTAKMAQVIMAHLIKAEMEKYVKMAQLLLNFPKPQTQTPIPLPQY